MPNEGLILRPLLFQMFTGNVKQRANRACFQAKFVQINGLFCGKGRVTGDEQKAGCFFISIGNKVQDVGSRSVIIPNLLQFLGDSSFNDP